MVLRGEEGILVVGGDRGGRCRWVYMLQEWARKRVGNASSGRDSAFIAHRKRSHIAVMQINLL